MCYEINLILCLLTSGNSLNSFAPISNRFKLHNCPIDFGNVIKLLERTSNIFKWINRPMLIGKNSKLISFNNSSSNCNNCVMASGKYCIVFELKLIHVKFFNNLILSGICFIKLRDKSKCFIQFGNIILILY